MPVQAHFIYLWMHSKASYETISRTCLHTNSRICSLISALWSHHNDPSTNKKRAEKKKKKKKTYDISFWQTLICIQLYCSLYSFSNHLFTFRSFREPWESIRMIRTTCQWYKWPVFALMWTRGQKEMVFLGETEVKKGGSWQKKPQLIDSKKRTLTISNSNNWFRK